jgi:thiol-disulfide isomerase/thioredoxin
MESRQFLVVVLVISVVVVGVVGLAIFTAPPPGGGETTPTTTTTTDTTTTNTVPPIIFRDTDLLEYNIQMPETKFIMTDGTNVTLADLRGKLVVIDFFATWCPACEFFNTDLTTLYETYGDSIHLISLTVNMGDTIEKLIEYYEDRELEWRFGQDYGDDWDDTAADFIGVRYIPTPVIIDENGLLRYVHEGTWRFNEMNQTISEIMS